ncbi:PPOX class F420-dependent oxidoreductase [Streptomyces sp. NPDC059402]|uniref:PPOX class F420-dependent oxidoreductase n=1 Tax=unclassified Streptomyces TaxID=2593676 RepID=UPI00367E85A2
MTAPGHHRTRHPGGAATRPADRASTTIASTAAITKESPTMTTETLALRPEVRALADGPHFAALTTLMPDGTPQTQVVWVSADGDHLLVNSEVERQKVRNLRRDPRATLMIWQRDNPYRYVEVRGRVTGETTGPAARAHIDELSLKYNGRPYPPQDIGSARITLRIAPGRQYVWGH